MSIHHDVANRRDTSRIERGTKRSTHSLARSGFVLVSVVVAILLVAMLAAALQSAALRADIQSRLGFAGEHALHAADAAIAQRITAWNARDFAAMPIGAHEITNPIDAQGITAKIALVRTNALAAWIEADVTNAIDGNVFRAHRRIARFVSMQTPQLPQQAALTALGPLTLDDATQVSGVDQVPANWFNDCAGIAPLANTIAIAASSFTGATPPNAIITRDIATSRTQFDHSWNAWTARAQSTLVASAPVTLVPDDASGRCAPASGEPLRDASASTACINEWSAKLITGNASVTFTGHSRYQGVLLIDGDAQIDGDLLVNGAMLIRGALNVTSGRLTVNGTLFIRDSAGHGSRIGVASRIQYSRCAAHKALAGAAIPTTNTQRTWFERP